MPDSLAHSLSAPSMLPPQGSTGFSSFRRSKSLLRAILRHVRFGAFDAKQKNA